MKAQRNLEKQKSKQINGMASQILKHMNVFVHTVALYCKHVMAHTIFKKTTAQNIFLYTFIDSQKSALHSDFPNTFII